jgi:hypothetical protein
MSVVPNYIRVSTIRWFGVTAVASKMVSPPTSDGTLKGQEEKVCIIL